MNPAAPVTPTSADEWSHKLAELLRSMPADLREPVALKGVLLSAVREMNASTPSPVPATTAAGTVHANVNPKPPADPAPVLAVNATPDQPAAAGSDGLAIHPSANPEWVTALREHPPVPSLKKVGAALNQPIRMARQLVETGAFDAQGFRTAYGNGWSPSNREFGRVFAEEIARCTEQQIAEGAPWEQVTHNALVGLTALTANVLTTGMHALMNHLGHHAKDQGTVSQSMAQALQEVFNTLPAGHPASHEESGMIVRGQMLEALAQRQAMELQPTAALEETTGRPLFHLRRSVR